jgi:hypothetical protein
LENVYLIKKSSFFVAIKKFIQIFTFLLNQQFICAAALMAFPRRF